MSYSKVTTEVTQAVKHLFIQGLQDPTFGEIAGQVWCGDPAETVPERFVRWIGGAIPTVRAILLSEGEVIISVGQFYYLPLPEEEGSIGGAGRAMPDSTDSYLIGRCMRSPWVGIIHCQEENPLLTYALHNRHAQVLGLVAGWGRRLAICDSHQLLDAESKKFLKQGGLKYQLN